MILGFFAGWEGEHSKHFPTQIGKEKSRQNPDSAQNNATKQPDQSLGNM